MGGFVGRAVEQAHLVGLLGEALDGRGGLALLAGEPGIGKTALCERLAQLATDRGALVRWGRCPESTGAPPFWPWRQAIGAWPEGDSDVDRFMFFEARAEAVRDLAAERGAVIVLDDLHWADEASLRLLEHLAPSLRDSRALVVGTYRDTEVDRGGALDRSLGVVARHGALMPVRGLPEDEVRELARDLQGSALDPEALKDLTDHTDGNPFFVAQVLRYLEIERPSGRSGTHRLGVPPGIGEVVRRRVERLGEDAAGLLARAAIVGREVDRPSLAVLAGDLDVDEAIGAATSAGLVETDATRPGGFRFVHALVREALASGLGPQTAAVVHEQLLGHLAGLSTSAPGVVAARAHHALGAVSRVGPEAAAAHVLAAGHAAAEAGGFEDAVRLAEQALTLDAGRRYEALVLLGTALFNVEEPERSESVLLEAAAVAEARGDGVGMARALLEIGGGRLVDVRTDRIAARLGDALRLVDESDLMVRADLLSRKADMLADPDEVEIAAREAWHLARRCGDPEVLVTTGTRLLLNGSAWMGPDERRAVVEVLGRCDDRELSADARMNRRAAGLLVLLEEGRLDEAAEALAALPVDFEQRPLVVRIREPVQVLLSLLRGRLDDAGEVSAWLVAETERRSVERQVGPANSARFIGLLRERDQGSMVAAVVAQVRAAGGPLLDETVLDVLAAIAAADGPDDAAAAHAIDVALAHDLERWARGWGGNGMALCCLLADGAREVGHGGAGKRLAPIVAAVADRNVVFGMPPVLALGWGSYYLGCCHLSVGDAETGAPWLEEALTRNVSMGALPFVARSHLALAQVRVAEGDGSGAVAHAREAHGIAVRAGLPALERRAGERLAMLGASPDGGSYATGTTTFVFTDIVDSTATTAAVGDRVWRAGLDRHTSRVRALAVVHGGRLVKSLGDGFMLTFPTARSGVEFALAVQTDVRESPFDVRVGVHTGEAELVDGDHIGHHVNLAARVSGAAAAGEVLVSDVVHTILAGSRDLRFGSPRTLDLKGIPDPQIVYAVLA